MTDLEMTKLCAEAMEIDLDFVHTDTNYDGDFKVWVTLKYSDFLYDPLYDDVQAMALVKHCGLDIVCGRMRYAEPEEWTVYRDTQTILYDENGVIVDAQFMTKAKDLNQAICECVAKMQLAKSGTNASVEAEAK